MDKRHADTTEVNKPQAASAEETITKDTDRFDDEKMITLNKMVADMPPKKADTNDSCSATAII